MELLGEATDTAASPNHHGHVGLARHAPVEGDATLLGEQMAPFAAALPSALGVCVSMCIQRYTAHVYL